MMSVRELPVGLQEGGGGGGEGVASGLAFFCSPLQLHYHDAKNAASIS